MSNTTNTLRSTRESWGSVTRTLHWLSAIVIIGLLTHGWWMTHLAAREVRQWNYATHALIAVYFALLLALHPRGPVPEHYKSFDPFSLSSKDALRSEFAESTPFP